MGLRRNLARWRQIQVHVPCATYGTEYGAWTVCPTDLDAQSVVYSFGVGRDVTWDLELIERHGVEVHAFDPTPRCIGWLKDQSLPAGFHFHPVGLATYDGLAEFSPPENPRDVSYSLARSGNAASPLVQLPVRRLSTLCSSLGHVQIHVLKMDIEGAEYSVLQDILGSGIPIWQVLIEFHERFYMNSLGHTRHAVCHLRRYGYRLFSIGASGNEFSFIHVSQLD
jgi:FkbM family methyltransferase